MFKLFKRITVVFVLALLMFQLLPIEVLLLAGMILFALTIVVFLLFHLGLQDFQGY